MVDKPYVIVFAVCGDQVLIAKGGSYVNGQINVGGKTVFELQRVTHIEIGAVGAGAGGIRPVQDTEADQAKSIEIFRERIAAVQTQLRMPITFYNPQWKPADRDGPNRFSTKFLYNDRNKPPGFIKGTFPDPKYPGEDYQTAARREFREETGVDYPLENFKVVAGNPNVFNLEIPAADKDRIISTWQSLMPVNELVALEWKPTSDICKIRLNTQSQEVSDLLVCKSPVTSSSLSLVAPGTTKVSWPDPKPNDTIETYVSREKGRGPGKSETATREHAKTIGLKGGSTIRRKKSKRSKKRGTLRKVFRR